MEKVPKDSSFKMQEDALGRSESHVSGRLNYLGNGWSSVQRLGMILS